MIVLQTERLYLRALSVEDAGNFFLLNRDPDVMRYTGDNPFRNVVEASKFLETYTTSEQYGFGRLAVLRQQDDEFMGWCGLKYSPENGQHDIGFRFFKKYWNRGYATEAARACLDYGFRSGIPVIVGRAAKENAASLKVLEKLGMSFLEEIDLHGMPGMLYVLRNPTPNQPAPDR